MDENKIEKAALLVSELTYLEWKKLRHAIDRCFEKEANQVSNKVTLPSTDKLAPSIKHFII